MDEALKAGHWVEPDKDIQPCADTTGIVDIRKERAITACRNLRGRLRDRYNRASEMAVSPIIFCCPECWGVWLNSFNALCWLGNCSVCRRYCNPVSTLTVPVLLLTFLVLRDISTTIEYLQSITTSLFPVMRDLKRDQREEKGVKEWLCPKSGVQLVRNEKGKSLREPINRGSKRGRGSKTVQTDGGSRCDGLRKKERRIGR